MHACMYGGVEGLPRKKCPLTFRSRVPVQLHNTMLSSKQPVSAHEDSLSLASRITCSHMEACFRRNSMDVMCKCSMTYDPYSYPSSRLQVFIGLFHPLTAYSQAVQFNHDAFPLFQTPVAISSHADHQNCEF